MHHLFRTRPPTGGLVFLGAHIVAIASADGPSTTFPPEATHMQPWRKFRTALGILFHSKSPWRTLHYRFRYNCLQWRLSRSSNGKLIYRGWSRIPFVADADDPETFFIQLYGHPDTTELDIIHRWLAPGDVCVDLGANIGWFSAVMAHQVGALGQVIAVEAAPATYTRLAARFSLLGLHQVTLLHACVGSATGEIDFHVPTDGRSSPIQSVHFDPAMMQDFQAIKVPVLRTDSLVHNIAPQTPPALVKMDVEGSEAVALAGCAGLIHSEHPPLFDVELNLAALHRAGTSVEMLLNEFPQQRFHLAYINYTNGQHPWPRNRLLTLSRAALAELPEQGNLIAIPRTGRFASRRNNLPQEITP